MVIVLLMTSVVGLFSMWMINEAQTQYAQTQDQRWDDVTVAGTEAILERYAAKLTIDPAYYLHWVDETERARVCADSGTSHVGAVVQPGSAWWHDCTAWTYQDPATTTWFRHPTLAGGRAGISDDIESRIQVAPPGPSSALELTVASRVVSGDATRVIAAQIRAISLSEYFRVTEDDLSYGAGAVINGRVYTGGDLDFDAGPPQGVIHSDAFAEGEIVGPPVFLDGSQGWDSDASTPYGDIRTVIEEPLDFSNFWDDLDVMQSAACNGAGICLNQAGSTAWRVQPFVSGGVGKIRVWRSTVLNANISGCPNGPYRWWTDPDGAWASWLLYDTPSSPGGVFDMPVNGTLWANGHVIVGHPATAASTELLGSLSIYAGSSAAIRNVIINSDIAYADPESFDVLGLIASNEVIINPMAVVDDATDALNVAASILGQSNGWRVARSCGLSGSIITPDPSTLNMTGSIATRTTGDIAAHFATRNYGFDARLAYLRPPFFPLLEDGWNYNNWRELPRPDWAH